MLTIMVEVEVELAAMLKLMLLIQHALEEVDQDSHLLFSAPLIILVPVVEVLDTLAVLLAGAAKVVEVAEVLGQPHLLLEPQVLAELVLHKVDQSQLLERSAELLDHILVLVVVVEIIKDLEVLAARVL